MKVLVIETTPATPHAETGLEIAIKEKHSGSKVVYCPIFHLLPILVWKSNINGRNDGGKPDTLADWLAYLINKVSPYAEVDVFELLSPLNYVTEEIRQNIFNFTYDDQPLGALVKSVAVEITRTTDNNSILNEHLDTCIDIAQTAILAYELVLMLVDKHQPDQIVFFNGRTAATFPIYLICKKLDIAAIIHERGATKDHYSLYQHPPQFLTEVKDKINRFSLGRLLPESRTSAAAFFHRQRSSKLSNFGPIVKTQDHDAKIDLPGLKEKFVVFFASSNWEIFFMPTLDFSNALGDQYTAVATLAQVCEKEGFQLVIRMHPLTPLTEVNDYNFLANNDKCLIVPAASSISSYRLGEASYRNFSYGSTITWELMHSGNHCAVLADSLGRGETGVIELDSVTSISEYLINNLPLVDKSFPLKYGDFFHNFGERYDYYKAETLFSGKFDTKLTAAT